MTATPPLPAFLADPHQQLFINGRWTPALAGEQLDTRNPANGKVLATLARGRQADVDAAVAAAQKAFEGPWRRFNPSQRQALLNKVSQVIEKHWDELAMLETLDMGVPWTRTLKMKDRSMQTIQFLASQTMRCLGEAIPNSHPGNFTTMLLRAPVGVVGGIFPWNGPLMGQWLVLCGTLATGCTAVLKPPEDASLSMLRTAELLLEAGVPEGVINVVTGLGSEAGAALAAHPQVRRLGFTGSTVTGREIVRASAVNFKRLSLELGGKSPDIIFADAELDKAVPGATMGVFNNSGQICYAGTRVFVQRPIVEEFVERVAAYQKTLVVGDPLHKDTVLGPIVSQRQMDRVLGYVDIGQKEGARLRVGGQRLRLGGELDEGYFVAPTVFSNVNNDMRIAREEIFGPVMSVIPFDSAEEALRLANDTEYGLGGAVWTTNMKTALKMVHGIEAGQVWVNCYGLVDMAVGFGGFKNSGYGWKGGSQYAEGFLYQKAVTINGD
jgi:aldehyde dehydrogenase (NAD+)